MTLWSVATQVVGLSSLFRRSTFFNPEGYGGWPRDSERGVDIVTGCFLLIRREFWKELGGFDLGYVMYGCMGKKPISVCAPRRRGRGR
jgi:GT2 family glycosyltransferase